MEIVTGAVTTGENFYPGRVVYIEELNRRLALTDLLLLGPRRTGKTSLIKEYLLRQSENKGGSFPYLYMNLEDTKGLYQFYFRLIRELLAVTDKLKLLKDKSAEFIANTCNFLNQLVAGKVTLKPDLLDTEVESEIEIRIPRFEKKTIDQLQNHLAKILFEIQIPIVIVLDEFPELILKFPAAERKELTKTLMSCARAIRQKTKFDDKKNHKIIIAGSINLRNTLDSLGLADTINDLEELAIPHLKPSDSFELFNLLGVSENFQFESGTNEHKFIETQFGYCAPYYIQLFADRLRTIRRNQTVTKFTLAHIHSAYRALILGDRGPNYFLKRIDKSDYYAQEQREAIRNILSNIAHNQFEEHRSTCDHDIAQLVKDPLQRHHLLSKLLADDMIQIVNGGQYGFYSQLICNFWHSALNGGGYIYAPK